MAGPGRPRKSKAFHEYEILGMSVLTIALGVVVGYGIYKVLKDKGKI